MSGTTEMNWKLKLCQVLQCFGEQEGTWCSRWWKNYGISDEEYDEIRDAFREHEETPRTWED